MTEHPIVDAHHHLWNISGRPLTWLDDPSLVPIRRSFQAAELEQVVQANGVDATVVVEARSDVDETVELLAVAADENPIAGVVGFVDLTDPEIDMTIGRLRQLRGGARLVGVRNQVQGEPDPRWLVRPDVLRGLAALAKAGLVYDLVVRPIQLPACVEAARSLPELSFVLDHLGKPAISEGGLDAWRGQLRPLAQEPNVVAKISGLVTEADWHQWTPETLRPYVETALELFGPDRLMFGSDWPVCLLAASYAEVREAFDACTATLAPGERSALLGATAIRTYGLALP